MGYKISANKLKIYTILVIFIVFLIVAAIAAEAGRRGGGGGAPAPPPPPCGYQTPGCYALDETKLNEPTTPQNFGYYLSQNACIGGSCTCGQAGFLNDIKNTDPDDVAGACACISGTSWTDSVGCCGDDQSDCGLIKDETRFGEVIDKHICAVSANLRIGTWFSAEANPGDIVHVGCNDEERLSDGKDWLLCDSFGTTNTDGHQYLCDASSGKDQWVECCGAAGCNSKTDGKRLSAGSSIKGPATLSSSSGQFITTSTQPSTATQTSTTSPTQSASKQASSTTSTQTSSKQEAAHGSTPPSTQPSEQTFTDVRYSGYVISYDKNTKDTAQKFCELKGYNAVQSHTSQNNPNTGSGDRNYAYYEGEWKVVCFAINGQCAAWINNVFESVTCERI